MKHIEGNVYSGDHVSSMYAKKYQKRPMCVYVNFTESPKNGGLNFNLEWEAKFKTKIVGQAADICSMDSLIISCRCGCIRGLTGAITRHIKMVLNALCIFSKDACLLSPHCWFRTFNPRFTVCTMKDTPHRYTGWSPMPVAHIIKTHQKVYL